MLGGPSNHGHVLCFMNRVMLFQIIEALRTPLVGNLGYFWVHGSSVMLDVVVWLLV